MASPSSMTHWCVASSNIQSKVASECMAKVALDNRNTVFCQVQDILVTANVSSKEEGRTVEEPLQGSSAEAM